MPVNPNRDPIVAETTPRLKLRATKDGAAWDLTGATVTLLLKDPSGTRTTKSATVLSASGGTAYYDVQTTDVTVAGQWSRSWRVVQGGVDMRSTPIRFTVVAAP